MIFAVPTDTCYWLGCNIYDREWYEQIFKLKLREKNKILSVAVKNFESLEKITCLNTEQIKFLKNYKYPFSIISEVNSEFIYPDFIDKKSYKKIAFRVWDILFPDYVMEKIEFPIFLTSANISSKKEIYTSLEIEKLLSNEKINIIDWILDSNKKPSNIFEFIWETLELRYIRKNY